MKRFALATLVLTNLAACDVPPDDNAQALPGQAISLYSTWVSFDSNSYVTPPFGTLTVLFTDGDVMDNAYANLGVNFSCVVCTSGHAYSRWQGSSLGVSLFPAPTGWPYGGAFDRRFGAVEATFDTPRSWVSIDATAIESLEGLGQPTNKPFFQSFDVNGNYMATVYHSGTIGQRETLTLSGGGIKKVRFSSQYNGDPAVYGAFDSLRFNNDVLRRPLY